MGQISGQMTHIPRSNARVSSLSPENNNNNSIICEAVGCNVKYLTGVIWQSLPFVTNIYIFIFSSIDV